MISIDLTSGVPLEEQIHRELRRVIAAGAVAPGSRLPSARQLGADLGVHFNTVARAYRRLADEGMAVVGRGRQVVVRAPDSPAGNVEKALRELVTEARLAGMTPGQLRDALQAELDRWDKNLSGGMAT